MSDKLNHIIEELKQLTLVEAKQLVEEIERTFDVDASAVAAPFMGIPMPLTNTGAVPTEVVEEKTAFDVILAEVPADKKIAILKVIRNVTGLGLKESKEIVDNIPKLVKEGVSKEESETIKKELEAAGAKVTLK
jgi:large subunit ribosomal protein L7/L12